MATGTREHKRDDAQPLIAAAPGGPSNPDQALTALRGAGQRLLDSVDAAINKALSTNSSQFLADNRQEGGE